MQALFRQGMLSAIILAYNCGEKIVGMGLPPYHSNLFYNAKRKIIQIPASAQNYSFKYMLTRFFVPYAKACKALQEARLETLYLSFLLDL